MSHSVSSVIAALEAKFGKSQIDPHRETITAALCGIMANLPSELSQKDYLQRVIDAIGSRAFGESRKVG